MTCILHKIKQIICICLPALNTVNCIQMYYLHLNWTTDHSPQLSHGVSDLNSSHTKKNKFKLQPDIQTDVQRHYFIKYYWIHFNAKRWISWVLIQFGFLVFSSDDIQYLSFIKHWHRSLLSSFTVHRVLWYFSYWQHKQLKTSTWTKLYMYVYPLCFSRKEAEQYWH